MIMHEGVHPFLSAHFSFITSAHNIPCTDRVPGPWKSAGRVFLNVCVYMWCLFCVIKCVIVKRDVFRVYMFCKCKKKIVILIQICAMHAIFGLTSFDAILMFKTKLYTNAIAIRTFSIYE